MSEQTTIYLVEYRNLLGDWIRDKRDFSRDDALAQARKVRRGTPHPATIRRQLRIRVRRNLFPTPPRLHLTDAERFRRVESAMGRTP